jgi:excisionase family DNA binding protein
MTICELRQWCLEQLAALGEPELGEPLTGENAGIVTQLKYNCAAAGLHELTLEIPVEVSKRKVSAVCQLRKVLSQLETPAPAVDGADLSVVQVAGQLGVSKETVYKLCQDRILDCNRVGRRITISPQQLTEYRSR